MHIHKGNKFLDSKCDECGTSVCSAIGCGIVCVEDEYSDKFMLCTKCGKGATPFLEEKTKRK
jgi:hypothetical protein